MASVEKNFVVKTGLTVGPIDISALTGDISTVGNITVGSTVITNAGDIRIGSTVIDGVTGNITMAGTLTVGSTTVSPTVGFSNVAMSGSYADLNNTPTTLAGYGITDAATLTHTHSNATISASGYMSPADKTKLDSVAVGATNVTNNNQLTNGEGFITSAGIATNVSGVVVVANGGTGLTAVGASGNILTSNGSTWMSSPAPAGGLVPTVVKTANYTATVNDLVRVDSTSGAFTITLPSTVADGDKVGVLDIANACSNHPVLVAGTSGKTVEFDINGVSANINGASMTFIYNSYNTNWKLL